MDKVNYFLEMVASIKVNLVQIKYMDMDFTLGLTQGSIKESGSTTR